MHTVNTDHFSWGTGVLIGPHAHFCVEKPIFAPGAFLRGLFPFIHAARHPLQPRQFQ